MDEQSGRRYYIGAIKNLFSASKTNLSGATGAALANAPWQACKASLAANAVQAVSQAQAAANVSAIKAACGG